MDMRKALMNLYLNSPAFIKDMVLSGMLLMQNRIRYGKFYKKYLAIYAANKTKGETEIRAYQLIELKKILIEAATYSPYYQQQFSSIGLTIDQIQKATTVDALIAQLPVLPKATLKSSNLQIRNTNRPEDYINHTSGTSGSPTVIAYDAESFQIGFALWRRFHDWIELPEKFKSVRLSGKILMPPTQQKPPFWVYNAPAQQLFMSVYHLTAENLPAYIDKLNAFKPDFIDAYPSAIYLIAQYINNHQIKLQFQLKAIATTAETLYAHYRVEIEKAFNCNVYNQYSSSEGGPFIVECPQHQLHLNLDSGVFEFLTSDGSNAKPGEMGELTVTSLRQWKTPLIRYRTGDWVRVSEKSYSFQACACGCQMPVVEEIVGRQEDILYTKEKGFVGRMDPAYKGLEGIVKSKIIQHTEDQFEVLNVTDENYTAAMEEKFLRNLRDRLGEQVKIEIKNVTDIPLGASGKFKAVERKFELRQL